MNAQQLEAEDAAYHFLRTQPVAWMEETFGIRTWSKQTEIVNSVRDNPYTVVHSGNGVGKSAVAQLLPFWFCLAHPPVYVVTTGASWTGVQKIVWGGMHKHYSTAKQRGYPLGGELLQTEWNLGGQWGAFAVSTNDPENFSGFRSERGALVIVDEASALKPEIFEAIMGLCAAEGSRVLLAGNPYEAQGPFFDCAHSSDWNTIHISTLDSPNVVTGKNDIPGLATRKWVRQMEERWGKESPQYRARVLGLFPEGGNHQLVKLSWLAGVVSTGDEGPDATTRLGVDVARYGEDRTVLLLRRGDRVQDVEIYNGLSTMETVGQIRSVMARFDVTENNVFIDDGGVGGGVTDRLLELDLQVNAVNFGSAAVDKERFFNRRVELYWRIREHMSPEGDRQLTMAKEHSGIAKECTWPNYKVRSDGRLQLESKDDIKKRRGQSPDLADALSLTYADDTNRFSMELL